MIETLWVKNYRILADVRVELEPITVFVGPNGSGKSNLIDALRFVAEALRSGLDAAIIKRHGMGSLRRWSAKGRPYDVEIGVSVRTELRQFDYQFTLGSESRGEYRVKSERCETVAIFDNESDPIDYEVSRGEWVKPPPGGVPALLPTALAVLREEVVHVVRRFIPQSLTTPLSCLIKCRP